MMARSSAPPVSGNGSEHHELIIKPVLTREALDTFSTQGKAQRQPCLLKALSPTFADGTDSGEDRLDAEPFFSFSSCRGTTTQESDSGEDRLDSDRFFSVYSPMERASQVCIRRVDGREYDSSKSTECVVNEHFESRARLPTSPFNSMEAVVNQESETSLNELLNEVSRSDEFPALVADRWKPQELQGSTTLQFGEKRLQAVRHRCQSPTPEALVFFLPGVSGGVGPCRDGESQDMSKALFPTLAEDLASTRACECWRLSWSCVNPGMSEATTAVVRATTHALALIKRPLRAASRLKVFFVGHSFGGGVAFQAASKLSPLLQVAEAEVGGVAVLASQWNGASEVVAHLDVPKFFVHGVEDQELNCCLSIVLHNMAKSPRGVKLYGSCGHSFAGFKETLRADLLNWLDTLVSKTPVPEV